MDATSAEEFSAAVVEQGATAIFHLAAILSAAGEREQESTWRVNLGSLRTALEVARRHGCGLFVPSSIAVFGSGSPSPAPQEGHMRPSTMYGITKLAGEMLCDYYHRRFGVDVRGLRYPGLVSHGTPPGGGTTDWAVEIFEHASRGVPYPCFLKPDTGLDIMYMPDATRAAIEIMEVDGSKLKHRNAYNITAMQLTPDSLAAEIRKHIPDFTLSHAPDPRRQAIADSWPDRLDDAAAREDWGWRPEYDAAAMTEEMLEHATRTQAAYPVPAAV